MLVAFFGWACLGLLPFPNPIFFKGLVGALGLSSFFLACGDAWLCVLIAFTSGFYPIGLILVFVTSSFGTSAIGFLFLPADPEVGLLTVSAVFVDSLVSLVEVSFLWDGVFIASAFKGVEWKTPLTALGDGLLCVSGLPLVVALRLAVTFRLGGYFSLTVSWALI